MPHTDLDNDWEQALDAFLNHCQRKSYPARAVIIRAGDPSKELFYLVKGSLSVSIQDGEHEFVLAYLHQGDFFGEIGLFDELHRRSAFVRSRSPCEVAAMDYEKLRQVLRTSPEIVNRMLSQLALRIRDTSRKAGHLAFMDVSGRVAGTLLELCDQPEAVRHPDGIQLRVTRQELGRLAGCSREVVGRVLKSLAAQDMISMQGRKILVHRTAFPPRRRRF